LWEEIEDEAFVFAMNEVHGVTRIINMRVGWLIPVAGKSTTSRRRLRREPATKHSNRHALLQADANSDYVMKRRNCQRLEGLETHEQTGDMTV
jgi:hypothetical protein